jgi:hypothetical protein
MLRISTYVRPELLFAEALIVEQAHELLPVLRDQDLTRSVMVNPFANHEVGHVAGEGGHEHVAARGFRQVG